MVKVSKKNKKQSNYLKSKQDLKDIKKACNIAMNILRELVGQVKPGVKASELDELAIKLCKKKNVVPAFKDYAPRGMPPFPNAASVCINDEVVHGISTPKKIIKLGDLVTVDFGIVYKGWNTDQCLTVGVEKLSREDKHLLETAKLVVTNAIQQAVAGNTTGDIGNAMQSVAKLAGFDVVKTYIGHGIGRHLHEAPEVPAYGNKGEGTKLQEGMLLCLEAQVVPGSDKVVTQNDGWTVKTSDGKNCAWFEYMVLITDKKPLVLTDTRDWPLIV